MAQYFTDFSEYASGVQPPDWTKRFHTTFDWIVEDDAGATGGKKLTVLDSTTNDSLQRRPRLRTPSSRLSAVTGVRSLKLQRGSNHGLRCPHTRYF